MLSRRFRAASLLVSAFSCPACNTIDRAGQDALVVGTFPVHAVTTPYVRTAAAIQDDGASPWVSPVLFAGHLAEDVGVTLISAGDLGIAPALGVVELASSTSEHPEPLRIYTFDRFPPAFHKQAARDAESDVAKAAARGALVVVYVGAIAAMAYYGEWSSSSSGWKNDPPMPRR